MKFSQSDFEPSLGIRWDKDFIWVQDTSLLQVVSDQQDSDTVKVRRHDGEVFDLDREIAKNRYFPIDGGACLKPVYAPVKAHVLSEPLRIPGSDMPNILPAGAAIVRSNDGAFGYILKDVLARDYEAVQYPSDPTYPDMPFGR